MSRVYSKKNRSLLNRSDLFMGYLLAGYPSRQTFLSLLSSCCESGVDIVEVGFPSKNPFADGEIIQNAHNAIDSTIAIDMAYWHAVRESCPKPLWFMGYHADLIETGAYYDLAKAGVVDAFVIPDNNEDTFYKMVEKLAPLGVDMVPFVGPCDTERKLREYFQNNVFVYYQLFMGQTGGNQAAEDFTNVLSIAHEYDHLRILAGFGINTPTQAQMLLDAGFDGFIIGTAMVRKLNKSPQTLLEFVKKVKQETKREIP